MKTLTNLLSVTVISLLLSACGGTDKETTVVHDRPVVVEPSASSGMTPSAIESHCQHGYDNQTQSCY